jgi:glycosyltransferase involved in cell wall biosynthesis
MPAENSLPLVSIVIPVRNEARHIEACVDAFDRQTYPRDRLEVLLVDGLSEDGTGERSAALQAGRPWLKTFPNPKKITPAAFNVGIREAQGEVLIIVGAHSEVGPEFVAENVRALRESGADCVGGRWTIKGRTPLEESIAAAMSSPFGVGGARYRYSASAGDTDTVPYACYWREVLVALGGFDERLIRNQDYELNWRLRAAGGRIYYDPAIASSYYVKRDWRGLWRQYTQYGLWKIRVIRMHPRSGRLRHYVAPAFVASLLVGVLLALVSPWGRLLLGLAAGSYLLANLAVSILTAARFGWQHLPRLPLAFAILHISWGVGFWRGLLQPRLEPLPLPDRLRK